MKKSRLKVQKSITARAAKILFLVVLIGALPVSSAGAAGREVTEQERICHEFLHSLFQVEATDAKELMQDLENENEDFFAEYAETEPQNHVISYDSEVLQSFMEENFEMADDKVKERLIANRAVFRIHQKSCETDSSILILSQAVEADTDEETYQFEAEILIGLNTQVIEGTICLEAVNDQWIISNYDIRF